MAANGVITITGSVTGLLTGSKDLGTQTITSTAAVAATYPIILNSGDNTISIPAGSSGALIVPSAGNVVALKLKGNAADIGIVISKTRPQVLGFDTSLPVLIINAASATSCEILFI